MRDTAKKAAEWAADLFEARTRNFVNGNYGLHSAYPEYRVSWDETVKEFPSLNGLIGRIAFKICFKKEIKKRSLLEVLQGKQTDGDWVKEHPLQF